MTFKKEFFVFIALVAATVGNFSFGFVPLAANIDFTTFILFVLVVGYLIYMDRRNVKLEGIVFMRRTNRGKKLIDDIANSNRTFWNVFGYAGIVIGTIAMIIGAIFIAGQAFSVIEGEAAGGVKILLPGPVSQPQNLPGVFVVQWWIWVIGIAIVLFPHEFMHGVMCRIDKVRIKAVGWVLAVIIPGAFVEPDEKQLKKMPRSTKMKVYAAGSFANIVTSVIIFLILAAMFAFSFQPSGVYVQPINDTPAAMLNITGTITDISGHPIRNQNDLKDVLSGFNPGDTVTVTSLGEGLYGAEFSLQHFLSPQPIIISQAGNVKTYSAQLISHPERTGGYLGVTAYFPSYSYSGIDFAIFSGLTSLLLWIFVFTLGIGVVNLLPAKPLDGGLLLEEIVSFFAKPRLANIIVKLISIGIGIMLLITIVGPFFIK